MSVSLKDMGGALECRNLWIPPVIVYILVVLTELIQVCDERQYATLVC